MGFGLLIKSASFLLPPIWYNETMCRRRRSQSTGGVERRDEDHGKIYNCISQRLRKYVSDGCGGPELCLQVMNTFAQHMGMVPISVPCNIGGTAQPAYGIKHVSGEKADRAVTEETQTAVRNYADHILRVIS